MRNLRSLLVAVPAFVLGVVLTITLTTTARAQEVVKKKELVTPKALTPYKVVESEADLNAYAAKGYTYVGQSTAASGQVSYTMAYASK